MFCSVSTLYVSTLDKKFFYWASFSWQKSFFSGQDFFDNFFLGRKVGTQIVWHNTKIIRRAWAPRETQLVQLWWRLNSFYGLHTREIGGGRNAGGALSVGGHLGNPKLASQALKSISLQTSTNIPIHTVTVIASYSQQHPFHKKNTSSGHLWLQLINQQHDNLHCHYHHG